MARTVLLLHQLPDGTSHFDWMIQGVPGAAAEEGDAADGPGKELMTFRVPVRIDSGEWGCFLAERISEHRADYLSFEGPVSGGRGNVSRVADGEVSIEAADEAVLRVVGRLGAAVGVFSGFRGGDGMWAFSFDAAPS